MKKPNIYPFCKHNTIFHFTKKDKNNKDVVYYSCMNCDEEFKEENTEIIKEILNRDNGRCSQCNRLFDDCDCDICPYCDYRYDDCVCEICPVCDNRTEDCTC